MSGWNEIFEQSFDFHSMTDEACFFSWEFTSSAMDVEVLLYFSPWDLTLSGLPGVLLLSLFFFSQAIFFGRKKTSSNFKWPPDVMMQLKELLVLLEKVKKFLEASAVCSTLFIHFCKRVFTNFLLLKAIWLPYLMKYTSKIRTPLSLNSPSLSLCIDASDVKGRMSFPWVSVQRVKVRWFSIEKMLRWFSRFGYKYHFFLSLPLFLYPFKVLSVQLDMISWCYSSFFSSLHSSHSRCMMFMSQTHTHSLFSRLFLVIHLFLFHHFIHYYRCFNFWIRNEFWTFFVIHVSCCFSSLFNPFLFFHVQLQVIVVVIIRRINRLLTKRGTHKILNLCPPQPVSLLKKSWACFEYNIIRQRRGRRYERRETRDQEAWTKCNNKEKSTRETRVLYCGKKTHTVRQEQN